MQKVTLHTSDAIEIVGNYRAVPYAKYAVILLHMMPATKESWDAFAIELDHAGFSSIAIDERGHGESTMHGTLDYLKFSEAEQKAKIHDVESAFQFLKQNGFSEDHILVIGGSIGANLAIEFLSEHASVPLAIALSPGLDYRGVKTDTFITQLKANQHVIIVASDDDAESANDSKQLHALNPSQTTLIEKHNVGHATNMFAKEPNLMQELIDLLPKTE